MNLCVVIPAYNHLPEVLTALNSLRALRTEASTTFHVQDDCSPDVFYPACIPPEVASVARNERNGGFAVNCNAGAREAMARYNPDVLFFVNQDVQAVAEWSHGWDTALLNAFAGDEVGIVGARLLFPNGAVQNAGGVFDVLAQPAHRCLGWTNAKSPLVDTPCDVDWTTGAAIAVQANLFRYLNGFDERYRMYFEDVDLCLRARAAKARIWYEPACTLIHAVGSTGGSPHFRPSAARFKQQWIDSGVVKAGTLAPQGRFW